MPAPGQPAQAQDQNQKPANGLPWQPQQAANGQRWQDSGRGNGQGHHEHLPPWLVEARNRWASGPRTGGPLRRARDDRLVGGVLAGIAARTGLDPILLRVALVVLTLLTSGVAAIAYVVTWLVVPAAGETSSIASRAATDKRGIALVAGMASILIIALVLVSALGAGWLASLAWPLIPCAVCLVLIWRNAPADEQVIIRRQAAPLTGLAEGGKPRRKLRIIVTTVLLGGGLLLLLSEHRRASVLHPIGGVVLIIAGIVVLLGPWWLRIARDLALERQARVRAEERADIAARVHDSVLQTLAMIQRAAGEPQRVVLLARAQERELRAWLFDGRPPGSITDEVPTVAAGVRHIQQEIEASYEVAVEIVTVGDCELDDDLAALLAASREATVNAAKWSGARVISLFAEVSPAQVALFVRDRGKGFDQAAVPGDRKGVAESIRARMERRGGEATIRSAEGEGTEVTLTMPRAAKQPEPSRS